MGNFHSHCSLTYLGSFQLFLHSDQPSEGEIISVQRCLPVGEAALSTPEAVASRTDWQTALMCKLDDDQWQHHITQSIIFSFSISLTFVYFASSVANTYADASACCTAAFASLCSSGIFVSRLCRQWRYHGNDVNSPWQAEITMQIIRAEIIAVTSGFHTSISLTVPPALIFAIRLAVPYAWTDHNQRPA